MGSRGGQRGGQGGEQGGQGSRRGSRMRDQGLCALALRLCLRLGVKVGVLVWVSPTQQETQGPTAHRQPTERQRTQHTTVAPSHCRTGTIARLTAVIALSCPPPPYTHALHREMAAAPDDGLCWAPAVQWDPEVGIRGGRSIRVSTQPGAAKRAATPAGLRAERAGSGVPMRGVWHRAIRAHGDCARPPAWNDLPARPDPQDVARGGGRGQH
jgi:hypothetical protein